MEKTLKEYKIMTKSQVQSNKIKGNGWSMLRLYLEAIKFMEKKNKTKKFYGHCVCISQSHIKPIITNTLSVHKDRLGFLFHHSQIIDHFPFPTVYFLFINFLIIPYSICIKESKINYYKNNLVSSKSELYIMKTIYNLLLSLY